MDFFCLTPIGIRVAYPSPPVLRALSRAARKRDRGKVVLALTSNRYYALHGVRPGARLARVSRRLHLGRGFHIGKNFWYVSKVGAPRAIVKVRHGRGPGDRHPRQVGELQPPGRAPAAQQPHLAAR